MAMKTNMERFEIIVENAKEMAIEVRRLEKELKVVEEKLADKVRSRMENDIKSREGAQGVSHNYPDTVSDHSSATQGFNSITVNNGKFDINIHNINPETGRDTTTGGCIDTLVEAVVYRNAVASELLSEGRIDFQRYLHIVRN